MSEVVEEKSKDLESLDESKLNNNRRNATSKSISEDPTTTLYGWATISGQPKTAVSEHPFYRDGREDFSKIEAEKMLRDYVVSFANTIERAVLGSASYSVECEDELQKIIITKTLEEHFKTIVFGVLSARENGYAVGQKFYKKRRLNLPIVEHEEGKRIVDGTTIVKLDLIDSINFLNVKDRRYIWFRDKKTGQPAGVGRTFADGTELFVPIRDLIWAVNDRTSDPLFGRSKLKNVYLGWQSSIVALKQWLLEIDQSGQRVVEIRHPEGVTYPPVDGAKPIRNDKLAATIARNVLTKRSYSIPSKRDSNGELLWEVKLSEISTSNGGNSQIEPFLNKAERMKALGSGVPIPLIFGEYSSTDELDASLNLLSLMLSEFYDEIERVIRITLDDVISLNMKPEKIVEYNFTLDRAFVGKDKLLKNILQYGMSMQGQMLLGGVGVPTSIPDMDKIYESLGIPRTTTQAAYNGVELPEEPSPTPGGLLTKKAKNDRDNSINRKSERSDRE